jgi:hypothetical protein
MFSDEGLVTASMPLSSSIFNPLPSSVYASNKLESLLERQVGLADVFSVCTETLKLPLVPQFNVVYPFRDLHVEGEAALRSNLSILVHVGCGLSVDQAVLLKPV